MSNPKFTPGPWVKDKYGRLIGSNGDQVEVSNFNVNVCYSTEESEANAILLECATQMYYSLELIIKEAKDFSKRTGTQVSWTYEAEKTLAKARGDV